MMQTHKAYNNKINKIPEQHLLLPLLPTGITKSAKTQGSDTWPCSLRLGFFSLQATPASYTIHDSFSV